MRTAMLVVATIGLVACRREGDDCDALVSNCDTGDPIDTDDTGDDTDSGDTDTGELPDPAVYEPDTGVQFDLATPVSWEPLTYSQPIYSGTIAGVAVSVTLGANVTGKSDVSLVVDSHLDRENDGDYVQYYTGVTNGGHLDNEMHINFPMVISVGGVQFDISGLVLDNTIPEANELDWVFDEHLFNTLLLSADTQSTHFVGTPFNWTWTSGQLDPGELLPYVTFDLDVDINYESTFRVLKYDIRDTSTHSVIATQTHATDRGDVSSYAGELGAEPSQILFDGKAEAELQNSLDLDVTLSITLESFIIDPPVTFPIPVEIGLGDDASWKITLDQKRITHPKDTTP